MFPKNRQLIALAIAPMSVQVKFSSLCKPINKCFLEYCIRLTSSEDQNLCRGGGTWADAWDGGALELVHNGNVIHTFQPLFESDEKCLRSDQVDPINDVFQIRSTTTDGVSFIHLRLSIPFI